MQIVHVFAHVKPESVDAFREATLINAQNSLQEPGVARFDVIQQQDDPTRFVLGGGLPHPGRPRAPQADPALQDLARHGGRYVDRTAQPG